MFLDPVTTLRRLGYRDDAKLLIIHGDDAGMCYSANIATAEALKKGIVTSTSVMVPCPWFLHFAEWAKGNPEADVGIHLTVTSEWDHYRWRPLSPADRVPSLVDKDGFFWRTTKELFEHAVLDEIDIEARAQIEMALRWGLNLLHIRRGQKDPRRGRCDAGELPDARRAVAKNCGVGATAALV